MPNNPDASDIETITGEPAGTLEELYKQDQGQEPNDSGSYSGSYSTTFSNAPNDPQDATITFDGGSSISGDPLYLLVKDGNQDPIWYVFDLSDIDGQAWNGTDPLMLEGFWPAQGAISHVAIYGAPSNGVPDGGATSLLLGLAVLGLAGFRRITS